MAKQKLTFLKSRGYAGKKVLRGETVEVDDFWAQIFVADGTAEPAKSGAKKKSPAKKKT